MYLLILGLVGLFFCGVQASSGFPPGITLCHKSDPNFQKCVAKNMGLGLKSFRNGSKIFGLPVLEPFFIKEMHFKNDPSNSITLEQIYRDVSFYGLVKSDIQTNFKLDLDQKCGWVMDVKTSVLSMVGDYELKGQILMFPLNGKGKCNVTMVNMYNIHTMTCEKHISKGKTYLRITNYTMDMTPENVLFDFENIFPDNDQIATEILKTLNENSLIIFKDVKNNYEELFARVHMTMANRVFDKVPMDEIFLE